VAVGACSVGRVSVRVPVVCLHRFFFLPVMVKGALQLLSKRHK